MSFLFVYLFGCVWCFCRGGIGHGINTNLHLRFIYFVHTLFLTLLFLHPRKEKKWIHSLLYVIYETCKSVLLFFCLFVCFYRNHLSIHVNFSDFMLARVALEWKPVLRILGTWWECTLDETPVHLEVEPLYRGVYFIAL